MNYEKKYKEALERAKRLHSEPTGGTERIVCEQIFPELKESEDEKKTAEWSEEDEEFLRRAIKATKEVYPVTANWLKSLKQRIGE